MKPHDQPGSLCSMDPISLVTAGLGTMIGGLFGGGGGSSAAAAPVSPASPATAPSAAPAAAPATTAMGIRDKMKSQQSTFLGQAATPPTQSGQKTLLGQ
jgi:hypothetical protein